MTDFAITLPGIATLSVCDQPPVGLKSALGFDVLTNACFLSPSVLESIFLFYLEVRTRLSGMSGVNIPSSSSRAFCCFSQALSGIY